METSREILVALRKSLVEEYARQLAVMPMKGKTREILADGFDDGVREGIRHAVAMLGVTVLE